MIIKSKRMAAAAGADGTLDHVFRGKNERIDVIQGCEQDVRDMVSDARSWRRTYAMRHFKIAPKEMPEPGHIREAVEMLAEEFGFSAESCVVVGHRKRRHLDTGCPVHYHVYVPEVDPATGRVLSSRWSYARQEKVSRLLEVRWGHAVVQGRFNASVLETLRADGFGDDADLLEGDGLDPEHKPSSVYTDGLGPEVLRKTARSMPDIVQAVQDARLLYDGPDGFRAALGEQGIRIVAGQKRGRWAVEVQDEAGGWAFSGALHRLLKIGVAEADGWITKKHGEISMNQEQERIKKMATRPKQPKARNWGRDDYDDLLAGVRDADALRQTDTRGMTPTIAAALDSGSLTHRLMSLLDSPGMVDGESALDRIEELLQESVAVQRTTNEKLDVIIRLLSPGTKKGKPSAAPNS